MKRILTLILLVLAVALTLPAQSNKQRGKQTTTQTTKKKSSNQKATTKNQKSKQKGKTQKTEVDSKQLKKQKNDAQKKLNQSTKELEKNKREQKERQREIAKIEGEIQTRVDRIHSLENRIDTLERGVNILRQRVDSLNRQLDIKKQRYAQAVRYARTQRLDLSPTVFVMSGNTPTEIVRRARYAQQYATYQRQLGEGVINKRTEVLNLQHLMLTKKEQLNGLLSELIVERRRLAQDRQRQQDVLGGLVKTQRTLDQDIERQRRQIAELDRKIEERIAYEIEQERKRAEAEARRKAEAAKKSQGSKGSTKGGSKSSGTSASTSSSSPSVWNTSEDRAVSGSFQQNKGRLPVPITGNYMITRRFGTYQPDGTRGVTLDNKGVDYTGQAGARARCIFDGIVVAIVNDGSVKHVLVRHGQYISVYCNLSSVIVTQGQKVRTSDLLGTVGTDAQGRHTLKFQLRKERTLLNPSQWIGR